MDNKYSLARDGTVLTELEQYSDRSAAIIGAAMVDEVVRDSIAAKFHVSDDKSLPLLAPEGPIGSYGARIRLAYALGIIGPIAYADLACIGKIRNKFAHWTVVPGKFGDEFEELTFRHQQIRDWAGNLKTVDVIGIPLASGDQARNRFVMTCIVIQGNLLLRLEGRLTGKFEPRSHREPSAPPSNT